MSIANNYKNFYQFIRKMSSNFKNIYERLLPTQKMLAKRMAKRFPNWMYYILNNERVGGMCFSRLQECSTLQWNYKIKRFICCSRQMRLQIVCTLAIIFSIWSRILESFTVKTFSAKYKCFWEIKSKGEDRFHPFFLTVSEVLLTFIFWKT